MPKTYTVKEVADILGYSTNSIYTFLKEKRLKGVRVGKGRFRIPEDELNRVLHLSRKAQPATSSANEQLVEGVKEAAKHIEQTGDAAVVRQDDGLRSRLHSSILPPNIFDWFVGTGAVVAGVALFLFNPILSPSESGTFARLIPVMRIVLIACGFGVLVSSMFAQGVKWRGVFFGLLAMLGTLNAYGLLKLGDYSGFVLYGAMALTIAIALVYRLGGIVAIVTYSSLISLLVPAVVLVFPDGVHIRQYLEFTGWPPATVGAISMVVGALLAVCFWAGYAKSRTLFMFAAWITAICEVLVAMWFGHYQYWSRAFFMIVVSYFTSILPYWWFIQKEMSLRMRITLHAVFYVVGVAILVAILAVHLLQQSAWDARKREFADKMLVAQNMLINAVDSVKSSSVVAVKSQELVTAVNKKDLEQITSWAKILYESNPNIRRVDFIDAKGVGIALYPYGTFDDPDYSAREYFVKAKTAKKMVLTNVFQARADNQGRYVVVIATPLLDSAGEFQGVMIASIDLDRLGLQLAQIANESREERFTITDSQGVILSHKQSTLIGTKPSEEHPVHKALAKEEGVQWGITLNGVGGMVGYRFIDSLGWAITLSSPEQEVFALKSSSIWWVLGAVEGIMLVTVFLFLFLNSRTKDIKEGGP